MQKILNILLVDDDPDELMLFKDALPDLGFYQVSYSNNYWNFCEFLKEPVNLPDIIFLDINIPGKDGKECLKELRNDKRFDGVPIIMYSNSSNPIHIEECRILGASLYIVKPTTFQQIRVVLKNVLNFKWEGRISAEPGQFLLN